MRWIIRGLIFIVIVGIVGMTALFAIPADEITQRVLSRVSEQTGREVVIRGAVRPRLFPVIGIRAEDIEIGNPDWVEEGPLVVAQALDVGVAWAPLLRGEIHLRTAELNGPRLILVRGEDGRVSWAAQSETPPATQPVPEGDRASETGGGSGRIAFDEIVITDAALLYVDRVAGQVLEYDPVSLRVSTPDRSGVVDIRATVDHREGAVTLGLALGSLEALQTGDLTDVGLVLDWPGGSAEFNGRAGLLPVIEGTMAVEADTLGPLFELAGQPEPPIPAGLGRDSLRLASAITLSETGSLHLRDTVATLDENQLEVELDLIPGEARPLLRGNVNLGSFAMGDSAPGDASGAGAAPPAQAAASGWSDAPIDASALFALDTDLTVTAERVTLGDMSVEALTAGIATEDGRSVVDLDYASVLGGAVAGQLVANGRGTFSARANLELSDILLSEAITAATGFERLQGTGSGQISLLAQGTSLAALMRDLDGEGALSFGPGAILGLDIAGMIRNFDAGFQGEGARTVYDGVAASFTVTDGLLANDDLALTAPWGAINGRGTVDLAGQRMDYLVTPGLSARDDGTARVNVPVRIEGPWNDLSFRPDLEALAAQELSEEIDALEEAAGDAARDLVRDQLGIELEDGADTDEAIDQIEQELGDRLEESISNGLRGLFD